MIRASRNSSIPYIGPAASQEAPESQILLEKGKGALFLEDPNSLRKVL